MVETPERWDNGRTMSRHTALFGSMRIGNIDVHTWESKAEQHKAMSTRIEAWYNRTRDVLRSGISPRDRVRLPSRREASSTPRYRAGNARQLEERSNRQCEWRRIGSFQVGY